MLATLDAFWQKASLYMNLPKISITDIVEIIIIAFLIYYMLVWIKNTRAWMLLRGLMVILLFVLLAALFQMNTIIWIARNTLNVLVIALVVIFQPEMRKALENLGRKNVLAFLFSFDSSKEDTGKFSDKTINEMVKACYEMGKLMYLSNTDRNRIVSATINGRTWWFGFDLTDEQLDETYKRMQAQTDSETFELNPYQYGVDISDIDPVTSVAVCDISDN